MYGQLEALPHPHALSVLSAPALPSAVRLARETAEQVLFEWRISGHHPSVGPALLILSELVTNSIQHAAEVSPQVTVIYAAAADWLAFAVHDRHPYQPRLYDAGIRTGRGGLATVMELTHDLCGTAFVRADTDGQGKAIWISLPL
ncbi:ATP-binding protein [Streptomyces sp. 769]|uniref:ATP-binding protein n=1 Tax=Streptomyces sp. 769 TaxID=1262452 RepID=UPI00057CCA88|nr:ATP-binding protein [Streptomyces sp. 769]